MKTTNFAGKQDILRRLKELNLGPEYRFKGSLSHDKGAKFYKVVENPGELPVVYFLREYQSNYAAYTAMMAPGWHPDPDRDAHMPQAFFNIEDAGSALPELNRSVCGYMEAVVELGRIYLPPQTFQKAKALHNTIRKINSLFNNSKSSV